MAVQSWHVVKTLFRVCDWYKKLQFWPFTLMSDFKGIQYMDVDLTMKKLRQGHPGYMHPKGMTKSYGMAIPWWIRWFYYNIDENEVERKSYAVSRGNWDFFQSSYWVVKKALFHISPERFFNFLVGPFNYISFYFGSTNWKILVCNFSQYPYL